jgi:hypothetical protein
MVTGGAWRPPWHGERPPPLSATGSCCQLPRPFPSAGPDPVSDGLRRMRVLHGGNRRRELREGVVATTDVEDKRSWNAPRELTDDAHELHELRAVGDDVVPTSPR